MRPIVRDRARPELRPTRSPTRSSSARRRSGRTSCSPPWWRRVAPRASRRPPASRRTCASGGGGCAASWPAPASRWCCSSACPRRPRWRSRSMGGDTALGGRYVAAPLLGVVTAFDPAGEGRAALRRRRDRRGVLIVAMNSQMLGIARLAYSLATNRQIPSAAGRLHERARHALRRDHGRRGDRVRARGPARHRLPGRHLRFRRDARVRDRPPVGDRAALSRGRPPERLPRAAVGQGRRRRDPAAGGARGAVLGRSPGSA